MHGLLAEFFYTASVPDRAAADNPPSAPALRENDRSGGAGGVRRGGAGWGDILPAP
jgi:hypothetical protein